ncbi:MAG: hypothetical protein AAF968_11835 [Pseudomonadota bacterium]
MNDDELRGYLACCNLLSAAAGVIRTHAETNPLAGVAARRELNIVADHMRNISAHLIAVAKDDQTPGHPTDDASAAGSPSLSAAVARTQQAPGAEG